MGKQKKKCFINNEALRKQENKTNALFNNEGRKEMFYLTTH